MATQVKAEEIEVNTAGKDPFLDVLKIDDAFLEEENMRAPQLTAKALLAGIFAGAFGSFLAIYNGLKTGIVPSLNIISALIGYFVCKAIVKCMGNTGIFTPQENVVIQTTAVACIQVAQSSGFASGLLGMGKTAAEIEGPGQDSKDYINLTWPVCFTFCCSVAFFGFFIAFPLRKYCIIDRKLQFPSGTATASVISTMHANAEGALANLKQLVTWALATLGQSLFTFFFDGFAQTPIPGIAKYSFTMDWDLSSMGIGMILPNTINASILLGGFIAMAIINPFIVNNHQCDEGVVAEHCWFHLPPPEKQTYASSYLAARAYYFYPGVAMVVVDGFYSILKLIYLLIKGMMTNEPEQTADGESDPVEAARQKKMADIFLSSKFPAWLLVGGYMCTAGLAMILLAAFFGLHWYETLLAVTLTPIFSVGIIVGVGMTDWDVSSSFGKLMMFPFGAMAQGSLISPLAACMITISGCGAAAGLMQDFKTGYLLGASPSTMFAAQIVGATAGCFIAPTVFEIFNSAYTLPGPPTQAVSGIYGTSYRVLAGVFASGGISALPTNTSWFVLTAAIAAFVLNLLADMAPQKISSYIPNAMAMSIGLMMGPGVGIDFLIGGIAVSIWRTIYPESCKKSYIVVASGCLAGGGIGQLVQILLTACSVKPLGWPAWS